MIIWLASFPHSGSTYLRVMLKRCFDIDSYSVHDDASLADLIGYRPNDMSLTTMAAAKGTFFVKTHELPADDFPALYLVRDGRDALVSYAHYMMSEQREPAREQTPDAFRQTLYDLVTNNASFGGWQSHVLAWTRRPAPTAILKFETLVGSSAPFSIAAVALKDIGYSQKSGLASDTRSRFEALHARRPKPFHAGRVAAWKAEMSPEILAAFWDMNGRAMHLIGYGMDEQPAAHRNAGIHHPEVRHDSHGRLGRREQVVGPQNDQPTGNAELIRAQEGDLLATQRIARAVDHALRLMQRELELKESVIQSFRSSYLYWFVNGPVRWIPWQRPLAARARAASAIFLPRIGILDQHAPRPLELPGRYSQLPSATRRQGAPSISIVTPSYNQGEFIERTIRSVLAQEYPMLEYVVQDGGSADGTLDVLRSFGPRLTHFESRPDGGQAHALNLGFQHTKGEIMCYLNSDDLLLAGALRYVAAYFASHPRVDVVYSHRVIIDAQDREIGRWVLPRHDDQIILWADYIPQETLFWRRTIWDRTGGYIDETYEFAMDWELILRFRAAGAEFVRLPRFLAAFRVQPQMKTVAAMDSAGTPEMDRLRRGVHGRDVDWSEIKRHTRPYLARSVFYQKLYRLGILRY